MSLDRYDSVRILDHNGRHIDHASRLRTGRSSCARVTLAAELSASKFTLSEV
jgi:hypothetical protein